jgi:predicted O-linked N-acetylglucosamine transferase (SPINDLY family)
VTPAEVQRAFAAAVAKHQSGDLAAAERLYRDILAADPTYTAAWCNLGVVMVRTDRVAEAAGCYASALEHAPDHPDAHFNLGNLNRRFGQPVEAADHYRKCLAANPNHPAARFNLGITLAGLGQLAEAEQYFRGHLRTEPKNPDVHARLGDVCMRAGKHADAIACFQTVTKLAPTDPRGWYNLGLAQSSAGELAAARETLTHALKLRPDYPEAHNALGLTLEHTGAKDEAADRYREAVRLNPQFADAWCNLGTNLGEVGRSDEAIDCLGRSVSLRPAPHVHSNLLLLLNYSSKLSPEQVFAEHVRWANRYAPASPPAPPVPEPHDPNRRLRVGYVSADFRVHTVSGLIELLLTHHDRERVEVFAYPNVSRADAKTDRFRSLADGWRSLVGLSDSEAPAAIRADRIDVLVDLGGHTASNRVLVFTRRPAPVQVTMFGYPNTTGMKCFDYRFTDEVYDPPGTSESRNTEPLYRLPDLCWVYRSPEAAPPVSPLPAESAGVFTFGCLNNPAKASDACLDAWATVLQAVPDSRLVMTGSQSEAGAKRIRERFEAGGIASERVELLPRVPYSDYLAAYSRIDVALDPFPFNGGITTTDALWMGVPVLTVAGNTYVGRQGVAVLTRLGLTDFVADSAADLVEKAKSWANRRPELAEIRASLRERMAASVVCDAPRYVKNLEAAYREVWRQRLPNV